MFSACVAAALLAAPGAAGAAPLHLRTDLTFPVATKTHAQPKVHRAYATQGDVGSGGDVTADPLVARPSEKPCVDTLFSNAQFASYSGLPFSYAPPAGCPGPYAKIVFNGDFAVSAGVQYDRTASIQLGNVPIFFGTTAEPSGSFAPTWHVERDVTDDAALLASAQNGEADIFNIVNATYTGVISGTAYLQFYPATPAFAAAATPTVVLPVPGVAGGPQHLNTGTDTLSATYTLPTNVVRAYLDVYSQGQQNDEFFYTCAPNDVAAEIYACGNGPLRETEVSIDGTPAGVAPVTPWIFTGGIDPYLWAPIPGAQTLEFKPYRIDLSPFASVLSNGKPHTISISVDNADSYFQGFATLFAYQDVGLKRALGAVTLDTLTPDPPATTTENLSGSQPSVQGSILVTQRRSYAISGYVNTSHGRTYTNVVSTLQFYNKQRYTNESATTGDTAILQATTDDTTVTTAGGTGGGYTHTNVSYPLAIRIDFTEDENGNGSQVTAIDQKIVESEMTAGPSGVSGTYESNEVTPADTLDISGGSISGNSGQSSAQAVTVSTTSSPSQCYTQIVKASAGVVTSVGRGFCFASERNAIGRALQRH